MEYYCLGKNLRVQILDRSNYPEGKLPVQQTQTLSHKYNDRDSNRLFIVSHSKTEIYIQGATYILGEPLTWNRETKTDKQK